MRPLVLHLNTIAMLHAHCMAIPHGSRPTWLSTIANQLGHLFLARNLPNMSPMAVSFTNCAPFISHACMHHACHRFPHASLDDNPHALHAPEASVRPMPRAVLQPAACHRTFCATPLTALHTYAATTSSQQAAPGNQTTPLTSAFRTVGP